MDLEEIREKIDVLDSELVGLLEERMKLVTEVAIYKKSQQLEVLNHSREQLVLEKVANQVQNPEYTKAILESYRSILKNSGNFQSEWLKRN